MAEQPSTINHIPMNTAEQPAPDLNWDESQNSSSRLMNQEGVVQLTQDLRKFSDTLTSLKTVFHEEKDSLEQSLRVAAHERLGDLLKVLKSVVNKYQELDSTGILNAAEILINHIKNYDYESAGESASPEIFSAINNLALAFSSSVSECLIGEINISPQQSAHSNQRQLSDDGVPEIAPVNVALESSASAELVAEPSINVVESVNITFERAKAWSKYANDLLSYVKKKTHIEVEYAKQLTKLSQATRQALSEQSFLPFQSLYYTSLDNDKEHASNVITTYQTQIMAHKFIEPLQSRRMEHDRQLKMYRDTWRKEKRRLEEAESNLKKAKQQYQTRNQEYLKAKEAANRLDQQSSSHGDTAHSRQGSTTSSQLSQNVTTGAALGIIPTTKAERKKKEVNDSYLKARHAEHYHAACVEEAKNRRKDLEERGESILNSLRDLMTQSDQTTKTVTFNFFSLHCDLASPILVQYQALLEESKSYEPGFKYAEYLRHVTPQHPFEVRQDYQYEAFATEGAAYLDHNAVPQRESLHEDSSPLPGSATYGGGLQGRQTSQRGISDTESSSSRSLDDLSPSASPGDHTNRKDLSKRRPSTEGSLSSEEILDDGKENEQARLPAQQVFKEFPTHSPDSSPAPQRSQFQVPKMKKMVANVREALRGIKRNTKSSIFGVDFSIAAQDAADGIPLLVKKCIAEIDNRALTAKGIYRVNGVKNRIEKLCAMLDSPQCASIDLSEQLPRDVSGVLKYFLRQLPEPLMLHRLYDDFLRVGKEYTEILKLHKPQNPIQIANDGDVTEEKSLQLLSETDEQQVSEKLTPAIEAMRTIIDKLPTPNRNTLQYIVAHLSRVAEHHNQNLMTASNLAIIFGPSLLRPTPSNESSQPLQSLIELPSQSQAIEMLITHRNEIFETYSQKAQNEELRDQIKLQSSIDHADGVQGDNRQSDPSASSQSPKFLPPGSESSSTATVPAASVDEPLIGFDDTLLTNDNHSTSGTSSSGDLFSVNDITAHFGQKDSVSGDSSQTSQSNGGMNVIDDGRTVIPHYPGLRKSSSSRNIAQGGLVAAVDVRNNVRDDIFVAQTPSRDKLDGTTVATGLTGISSIHTRPRSLATDKAHTTSARHQGSQSENQQRSRTPSGDDGLSSNPPDSAPIVPMRLKSRRRSSDRINFSSASTSSLQDQSLQPSTAKAASPHRPRSSRISGLMPRPTHEKFGPGEPRLDAPRRASEAVLPSQMQKPVVSKMKRHSAFSNIINPSSVKSDSSSKGNSSSGRKLPQVPAQPISPTRQRPASMPGRTPPFNKTQAWTYAKGDLDIDGVMRDHKPHDIQRKILMEEEEGESDSYC